MKQNKNELKLTRIYEAPVELVWDAWTDPKKIEKWWGPRGFTLTTKSKDLKPGGKWIYTMHGPDGTDYPNIATYHQVEKYSYLEYDHGATETTPPLFRVKVKFQKLNEKTEMEMTMILESEQRAHEMKGFIEQAGGESTWDRLAEFVEENLSGKDIFVIHRTFEADLETMFQMWTDPKHIMNWLPPSGFSGKYIHADIREGGEAFYSMSGHGMTMYGKAKYLEIKKPHRLVYTQVFSDKDGNVSRHPMAPTWPEEMKTTVLFFKEDEDHTLVCIRWEVYGDATQSERDTFSNAKSGMTQGWSGSFKKLEEYVSK